MQRLTGIADDQSDHAMVHGVARGNGVNVDFRFGQSVDHASQGARAIIQKDGQLFGNLHKGLPVALTIARALGIASSFWYYIAGKSFKKILGHAKASMLFYLMD